MTGSALHSGLCAGGVGCRRRPGAGAAARRAAAGAALAVALAVLPAAGSARVIVRLPLADVPAGLRGDVDPCAVERGPEGLCAILLVTPEQAAALAAASARCELLGPLDEHLRRFAPRKTLRCGPVPSLAHVAPQPGAGQSVPAVRGPDPCSDSGVVSLAPYDTYHRLEQGQCLLDNLAAAFPHIAAKVRIGASVEGRDIWALKVTDYPDLVEPDEERILLTGVTHAREWITHEVVLCLAEYLTTRYATDPQVRHIVDHSVVWLVPAVNPDGFVYSWDYDRMWRKNRRPTGPDRYGIDLNRNYAYRWGWDDSGSSGSPSAETYRGPYPASEPETQAIQDLLAAERFAIAVSFHSYSQLCLTPWGYTGQVLPQSAASLRALGRKYVRLAHAAHGQVYVPGQSSLTLYATNGDFNDHAYGAEGALALTIELRPRTFAEGGFLLPEEQIRPCCEENTAAALWLMLNVASAVDYARPGGGPLVEAPAVGSNPLALPCTPVCQKPQVALGYPPEHADALRTWLDDAAHQPPGWGVLGVDFEGCGVGGYRVEVAGPGPLLAWLSEWQSYKVLPYVFEDGAEIVLSNVAPGLNLVGVPTRAPLRLDQVRIARTIRTGADFLLSFGETVVAERTALEDAAAPAPWLDWTWEYVDAAGHVAYAHPAGADGASPEVLPLRAYNVHARVPSFAFGSHDPEQPVTVLRLPGFSALDYADCNYNAVPDADEIAAGAAADCNANGVPDSCDLAAGTSPDCNGNGRPDECDVAVGDSADCAGEGVPDECEPDCNANGLADSCDIAAGTSADCAGEGVPDECEPDCNANGLADSCDMLAGASADCDRNGVPDECQPRLFLPLRIGVSGALSAEFLYYLEQAGHRIVELEAGLAAEDLAGLHALMLATGSVGGGGDGAAIDAFVAAGGGLVQFAASADAYRGAAYPLAGRTGWTLRAGTAVAEPGDALAYGLAGTSGLTGYGTLPVPKSGARVPLAWQDGTPLAIARPSGAGRAVYINDLWASYQYNWRGDPAYGAALLRNVLGYVRPGLAWDCNANGVEDACDIFAGTSADADGDGVPDECTLRGDLNCDRRVDFDDIEPFVLALVSPAGHQAAYPGCGVWRADLDGDGAVTFDDIDPFVELLAAGGRTAR